MQRASVKPSVIPTCITLLAVLAWGGMASAQDSAANNIRPVAQVCLAGQPCVGSVRNGASGTTASTAVAAPAAPAPVAATPAAAPEVAAAPAVAAFDAAQTYQMSCFACHGTGAAGAPKLGDAEAWTARLEKGMDSVMVNVTNGINAMPPKGMCMTCSDADLRALVDYMISQ